MMGRATPCAHPTSTHRTASHLHPKTIPGGCEQWDAGVGDQVSGFQLPSETQSDAHGHGWVQGGGLRGVPRLQPPTPPRPGKQHSRPREAICRAAPGRESSRVIRAGGCESANDA